MVKYKDNIIKLSEKCFLLGLDISYKFIGLAILPLENHYACIIIHPSGKFIKNKYKCFKNYLHDDLKENGNILELKDSNDIFSFGIPHILIYKKDN